MDLKKNNSLCPAMLRFGDVVVRNALNVRCLCRRRSVMWNSVCTQLCWAGMTCTAAVHHCLEIWECSNVVTLHTVVSNTLDTTSIETGTRSCIICTIQEMAELGTRCHSKESMHTKCKQTFLSFFSHSRTLRIFRSSG